MTTQVGAFESRKHRDINILIDVIARAGLIRASRLKPAGMAVAAAVGRCTLNSPLSACSAFSARGVVKILEKP